MKIKCAIATDYQGNPRLKITKDCPQLTIDCYTEDYNLLKSLEDKELTLSDEE